MLFWRCKNASKQVLWHDYLVSSFFLHLFVLLLIFVVYRTDIIVLVVTAQHPLQQHAAAVSLKTSVTTKNARLVNKVASKPAVTPTKKHTEKTTSIVEQKKKKVAAAHPKKKNSSKEKKQVTKNDIKKELIPPQVTEQKKPELPKEIKPQPQPEPVVAQAPVPLPEKNELAPQSIEPTTLAPIAIGEPLNNVVQDPLFAKQYAVLQEEVGRHWKPPAGIQPRNTCHISACVAHDGTLQTLTIAQSSGILVFDIAARKAVVSSELPQWIKGKAITIVFK